MLRAGSRTPQKWQETQDSRLGLGQDEGSICSWMCWELQLQDSLAPPERGPSARRTEM